MVTPRTVTLCIHVFQENLEHFERYHGVWTEDLREVFYGKQYGYRFGKQLRSFRHLQRTLKRRIHEQSISTTFDPTEPHDS